MEVDFVRDLTVVDVRYRESTAAPAGRGPVPAAGPVHRTTPTWESA
ncbi:hypothetical protein ACQ4WX_41510 [Streptomyces lasalocidi]